LGGGTIFKVARILSAMKQPSDIMELCGGEFDAFRRAPYARDEAWSLELMPHGGRAVFLAGSFTAHEGA
jgi:hypothetical protein